MKKAFIQTLLSGILACICVAAAAQSPNAIPYQAVARNSNGNLLQNKTISLRFSILNGSVTGSIVYQETQTVTTNQLGLFTLTIGGGTPVTGVFNNIDWADGLKFTQVEMDTAGGTNYVNMGTTQMLSVPYALHATKADTATSIKPGTGAAAGYVLQSDGSGNAAWANPLTGNGALRYVGSSYLGVTSGPNGKGANESVGANTNLGNVFLGNYTGYSNQRGASNIALGNYALQGNNDLKGQIAIGDSTLNGATYNSSGDGSYSNIAIGHHALTGVDGYIFYPVGNVAIGYQSQSHGTTYHLYNTSVGYQTLMQSTGIAASNSAFGYQALMSGLGELYNAAVGYQALKNSNSNYNTAIGYKAGANIDNGQKNTFVGANTTAGSTTLNNATAIGYGATVNTSNSLILGNGANIGIGTSSPTQKLEVAGTAKTTNLQITSGAASGYLLQSDASGNASWVNNVTVNTAKAANLQLTSGAVKGYLLQSDTSGNASWVNPANLTTTGAVKPASLQLASGAGRGYLLQSDAGGNASWVNPDSLTIKGALKPASLQIANGVDGYILKGDDSGNVSWADPTNLGALRFLGSSYVGVNAGPGNNGTSEGTGYLQQNIFIGTAAGSGTTTAKNTVALGYQAGKTNASGSQNTFLGYLTDATYDTLKNASALGYNAKVSCSNCLVLGNLANIGIGTSTPTQRLDVAGTTRTTLLQITKNPGDGYLLKSDADGLASWVNPANLTTTGTVKPSSFQITTGAANGYLLQSNASGVASWVNPATITTSAGVNYVGNSYLGTLSGAGGTGNSEGTSSNLTNINIGANTGYANTTGNNNIVLGDGALKSNDALNGMVAIGNGALASARYENPSTGNYAVAIGYQAMNNVAYPVGSVAIGYQSQYTIGGNVNHNTTVGYQTLSQSNNGSYNTAFGYKALGAGNAASYNTATGSLALLNASGQNNTALGYNAGNTITSGNSNTFIGYNTDASSQTLTNATAIGANAVVSASNSLVLGNNVNVGVGTSFPGSRLDVNGPVGLALSKQTGSDAVTLDNTAAVWYFTGTASITLPRASASPNRTYTIVNRSGNSRTISSYVNFSGSTVTTIGSNRSIDIISDGTNWLQIR